MFLPKARTENIVNQNLKDEVLIFNLVTNKAFCLNKTAATVYQMCDGTKTFEEIKNKTELSDEAIYFTLDELKSNNLLDDMADYVSPFASLSRREVIKKVGLVSMAALPLIAALVAPTSASAASICTTGACIPAGQNICAGCANQTILFDQYGSTDGTCTNIFAANLTFPCGANPNTSPRDIRRK